MCGGGGGGSQAPTETTVTQTNLPEYVQPYFERILKRAEAESLQPLPTYGGQRLAYFSPDELVSGAMTRGFATSGTPAEFGQAFSNLENVPTNFGQQYFASSRPSEYTAGVTPTNFRPINFEEGVNRFMSPYQQGVIDIAKREARRESDIAGGRIEDAASQAGGLGGYREAILQAERERGLGQRLSDIQTRGSQAAFDRAVAQVGAERAADLAASRLDLSGFQIGEQARQRQEQLAQQAFARDELARQQEERMRLAGLESAGKLGITSAQALQDLGKSRQADNLARIAALRNLGAQERALNQAALDIGYEDFLRQRDFTGRQLGLYSNLLRGVPVSPERTVSTFAQQPGLFQQLVGAGLSGLGLYRGLS
tara:strand:- start:583 stop:1689 length:1107 start_codon:yes stop_codon:yes gene_type:complete